MTTFDEIPDISTRPDGLGFLKLQIGGKKLKLGDIAWVSDKLATTQGAGLPLYRSLGMLARMKAGTPTGDVLTDVVSRMNDGASFTNSIRAHEDALGSLPCALIEAGEQSGTLQRAFDRISHNAEVQIRLRRKIRAAMSYPLIVLSISLVLIFVLLTFVVPQFATLFKNANESLPWLTKDLLWASKHVAWGFGIIIAIGAIIWTVMHFKMLPESSLEQLERVKYGVPVFGGLAKKTAVART